MRKPVAVAGIILVAALALTGCSGQDKLNTTYSSNSGTGYTDETGAPVLITPAERTKARDFSSTTEDGTPFALKDYRGKVVVVNFWYATCVPCRVEAPILQGLYEKYQGEGVSFVGVNVADQPDTAMAFEKRYGVTYPSVMDVDKGTAAIAFAGSVSASAVPTTFVLDKQGRIAARISGQLQSQSILNTLISDTQAEGT